MINFRVSVDGHDEQNVTAGPRDVLKWETDFPGAAFGAFLAEYSITKVYQVAWCTLRRLRVMPEGLPALPSNFREFLAEWDVQPGHDDEETDAETVPTRPEV